MARRKRRRHYGAARHSASKVSRAFWRGRGGRPIGMTRVGVTVEIGRAEAVKWKSGIPMVQSGRGIFGARACIKSASGYRGNRPGGHRCAFAQARTPTRAFNAALRKLAHRTR